MKNISTVSSALFMLLANICSAQVRVIDDFNDGEFANWSGSISHFIINPGHQLQLNNTVASTSYLTTSFAPDQADVEWNVYVRQAFAGSANNYGRIYLLSDKQDLTQSTEGYYLQLGEAGNNDAVELFRQTGVTSVSVCRAGNATIASSFAIRIKVTRSSAGQWLLLIDYNGGTDYVEAASGVDATYTAGQWTGIVCVYTAGNATRFFYDDYYAGPTKPDPVPGDVADKYDVVINEFFPDPAPSVGLPEQEFVEIYNRSSKTFDLRGWKIGDATSLVAMPGVVIHPDEYLLIDTSNGLPSLNNGGDVVKLVDDHNLVIDSINYTIDWYQDQSKSGGGYSIERVDPGFASNDMASWYVSLNETGGTPGSKNSLTSFVSHPVKFKDLIVTEIMADPSPVVQLPEAEYIEVFNRSGNPVNLTRWTLEDATTSAQLPSIILMPDSYLVLTSTSNASKFSAGVDVVGVTSFPSLGNLGDRVVLREPGGVAIDSLAYNLSWYQSSEKGDGGWSLELIDVNNPCGEGDNWTASEDLDGGTPGKVNSVFANKPDVTPPQVLNVFAISGDTIIISFNEKLRDVGSISLNSVASFKDLLKREIVYILNERLELRRLYSITISDVTDCNGNRIEPITTSFTLPEAGGRNDVIINEVLFNPKPGGVDFVEIYNRSEKHINLVNWSLSGVPVTGTNLIMNPNSYFVFTSSTSLAQSNYPFALSLHEMPLPSLPDDGGTIALINNKQDTVDVFSYDDDMHSPILSDTEGVSLERINPEEDDWHSANASAGYATPGRVNSNARAAFMIDENISVSPEVVNPSSGVPFSQIFYHFDRGGMVGNVSVVDLEGRVIKTIASNETLGTEGSFQWDGDRSEGGLARSGYYMIWFQVFDPGGRVDTFRRRIVLGL